MIAEASRTDNPGLTPEMRQLLRLAETVHRLRIELAELRNEVQRLKAGGAR